MDGAASNGMKTCPFCAEEIRADAVKCKHCGEFLEKVPGRTSDYEWTTGRKLALAIAGPALLLLMILLGRSCSL